MDPSAVVKAQNGTDMIIAVVQQGAVAVERGDLDAALGGIELR